MINALRRYSHTRWPVLAVTLAAALPLLAGTPARADGTCPPGTSNPSYCQSPDPINNVKIPPVVAPGQPVQVQIKLRGRAKVTVEIRQSNGRTVAKKNDGVHSGTIKPKITAPNKPGTYTLVIIAKSSKGTVTIKKTLKVKKR